MKIKTTLFLALCIASPLLADQFEDWDTNKDGKLSREELPEKLRPNFDKVDTNHDGFITRDEHQAFISSRRPSPPKVPDTVKLNADIRYADTDKPSQRLDLLLPTQGNTEKPLPVIVYIHGGGWKGGTKDQGRNAIAPFVTTGDYAGVSVEYRLSGEAIWPAQIEDCKAAIRWIKAAIAAKKGKKMKAVEVMTAKKELRMRLEKWLTDCVEPKPKHPSLLKK